MRPLFKKIFLSASLILPAVKLSAMDSLLNLSSVVDEYLSPGLFSGQTFSGTTGRITEKKSFEAAEALLKGVYQLRGQKPEDGATRDFLSVYVVVNHPEEAFDLQNGARVRMSRKARELLNKLEAFRGSLELAEGYALDDLSGYEIKKCADDFVRAFEAYRTSFNDFLGLDRDHLLSQFIGKYIEIERVLLAVQNREETLQQEFSEGFKSQLTSLSKKIRHLGKEKGLELLAQKRKSLHDERREDILYNTSIGTLYRLKAIDPDFRVTHTPYGAVSQGIRQKAFGALSGEQTEELVGVLKDIRHKLANFKPLKKEVREEIFRILGDENLLTIARNPTTKEAEEAIGFVIRKLNIWGLSDIESRVANVWSGEKAESFANVLMEINNGIEELACQFIDVTLNQTHSKEITQWEKELFDQKVSGFDISLTHTVETASRLTEHARNYDLDWSDFSGPKGAELLLYAGVLDVLKHGQMVNWDDFPETWLSDRERWKEFAGDFDLAVLQASALLGVDQLAKQAGFSGILTQSGEFLDTVKILFEENAGIHEMANALSYRLATVVGKQHEPGFAEDQVQRIENCLKKDGSLFLLVESRLRGRVTYYLQTGLETSRKLTEVETLVWENLKVKTRKFIDVLQHNLDLHRERYQGILMEKTLDRHFRGMLSIEGIKKEDYPLVASEDLEAMQLIQGRLLHLAGVLNGLTMIQKAVLHSRNEYGGAFFSNEEVAEKARTYNLFDHNEKESVVERLTSLMLEVFSEKNITSQTEEELPLLKGLLKTVMKKNPGTRHYFSYLADQIRASVKYGKKRHSAPGLATVFEEEIEQVTGQAKNVLKSHMIKKGGESQSRGLYRPLPKLKAGK